MRKIICAIILGGTLVNTCYSESDSTNPIEVYGGVGLSFAMSPEEFKEYQTIGFNLAIGARRGMNISLGNFDISIGGRLDFSSLDLDGDKFLREKSLEEDYSIIGRGTSVLTFLGTVKASLSSIISPYFSCGMGFLRFSTGNATICDSSYEFYEDITGSLENTFGISLGVGVEAGTPFGLLAEGQYVIGWTQDACTQLLLPIKLGVIYKW